MYSWSPKNNDGNNDSASQVSIVHTKDFMSGPYLCFGDQPS